MNHTIIDALFRYFETLYNLNQHLIVLCGTNSFDHMPEQECHIDEVIMNIPRLIPYKFKKNSDKITLINSDGLMRFSSDIPTLTDDYESILKNHNSFLIKVKRVRNKLEHEIDNAKIVISESSPSALFSVTYKVDESEIDLCAEELIEFVKNLNIMFSKIQKYTSQFACQEDLQNHPYFHRLTKYDFTNFNRIYESDLLYVFGQAMLPF